MPRHDAPVVTNLRRAGAVIVGKTNLHEFAFGTTSDETAFGAVRNPHDRDAIAGRIERRAPRSAIVEGMVLRLGRHRHRRVDPDSGRRLRHHGPEADATARSTATASCRSARRSITSGRWPAPSPTRRCCSAVLDGERVTAGGEAGGRRRRTFWLGVPVPYFFDKLDDEYASACSGGLARRWRRAGHTIDDVTIAHAERTADVYLHIVLPEASWYHAPLLESHADKYSPGVRLRLEMGRYILAEDYLRAMHARPVLRTGGGPRARRARRAAPAGARDRRAGDRGAIGHDRRSRRAGARDRCCGSRSSSTSPAIRRSRFRAAWAQTGCPAVSSSSATAAPPSACWKSRRPWNVR